MMNVWPRFLTANVETFHVWPRFLYNPAAFIPTSETDVAGLALLAARSNINVLPNVIQVRMLNKNETTLRSRSDTETAGASQLGVSGGSKVSL